MMFKRELVELILAGKKTQTRRALSENPRSPWAKGGCSLRPGRPYAVTDGRGKPAVCHVELTADPRVERAGDITEADAIAEGFENRQGFIDYWTRLYGEWVPDTLVWVLCFRLVSAEKGGEQDA